MNAPLTKSRGIDGSVDRLTALLAPTQALAYDPTKHLLGYGRRDAATGMLHGHIRWPDGSPATPFGCRWCGGTQSGHGRRWLPGRGMHAWARPTEAQILARMKARREARKAVCRCPDPNEPFFQVPKPLAPVVDPWRCEADNCRMHDYLVGMWLTPMFASGLGGASC
ncbi:hypothetical protein ACIRJS_32735 [Streptomyces sp. NPDC102340]|uniref:hypothetical protein n=1 Tax=unclassified Streptomyces TaxID=2593676 RepID=UPI003816DF15